MRRIVISSTNAGVVATKYDVTVEGKSLEDLLIKGLKKDNEKFSEEFRAKVTVIIEEIEDVLVIEGIPEDKEEVSEDGESEII